MGDGRDVYQQPKERAVIRTADVYQTVIEDGVAGYSDTLLSVVANFKNAGAPEGFNAQSMVGKSKRGEVALRLFALIDPDERSFVRVGFKTRGCLAMTACASVVCTMLEGITFTEALSITPQDITDALDGVPWDKVHTPVFAVEGVRALVGDWLIGQGATLDQLDRELPCDEYSVTCMMCEHCSLRDARIEAQVSEVIAQANAERERAEKQALAAVFDDVRAQSSDGKLVEPTRWCALGLVPDHLSADEFEMMVYDYVEQARAGHTHDEAASVTEPALPVEADAEHPSDEASPFANLNLPAGYTLVELEGEWVMVPCEDGADTPDVAAPPIDCAGITALTGEHRYYLYDSTRMTDTFATWAFLAAEDNKVATFVHCVREDSRVYPRPLAASSLTNDPFNLTDEDIARTFDEVCESGSYPDIQQVCASNGDVYYFSTDHLSRAYAASLAEWVSVERLMNV